MFPSDRASWVSSRHNESIVKMENCLSMSAETAAVVVLFVCIFVVVAVVEAATLTVKAAGRVSLLSRHTKQDTSSRCNPTQT